MTRPPPTTTADRGTPLPGPETAQGIPRLDVGGGTLAAVLVLVLTNIWTKDTYDIKAWESLAGLLIVFAAGYLPTRYKSFTMAVAATLATLVAYVIGLVFYGVHTVDNVTISMALTTFAAAFFAYILPAKDPDNPAVPVVTPYPPSLGPPNPLTPEEEAARRRTPPSTPPTQPPTV